MKQKLNLNIWESLLWKLKKPKLCFLVMQIEIKLILDSFLAQQFGQHSKSED